MVVGTLGGVAACPAIAVIAVIDGYDTYSKKGAVCEAPYPGPGKW